MSLDVLRLDALTSRNNELNDLYRAHYARRDGLTAVTKIVSQNLGLSDLLRLPIDSEASPLGSENSLSLKSSGIANGQYFDETSIPFPSVTQDDRSTLGSKLNRRSSKSPEKVDLHLNVDAHASEAPAISLAEPTASNGPMTTASGIKCSSAPRERAEAHARPSTYAQKALSKPDGPVAASGRVAPRELEDEAEPSESTNQLPYSERSQGPAHIRSPLAQDAQEERLREAEERRRKSDASDPAKYSRIQQQSSGEMASSPSSTVGAYSAATPMPPQDSPDTSPDSETAEPLEVPPPKELQLSPEEQREKDEHERLLAVQKDIAHRQALGDVADPDEQLRWEEREAAARDAEERAAREDVGRTKLGVQASSEATQVEDMLNVVNEDKDTEQSETSAPIQDIETVNRSTSMSQQAVPPDTQEDGDNITVARRNKAPLTIDTSKLHESPVGGVPRTLSEDHEPMTTKFSSAALQKQSVPGLLDQTPSQAGIDRRNDMSPEGISPTTFRQPQTTPAAGLVPATGFQSLRRASKQSGIARPPAGSTSTLEDLMVLKGAAEDPDKDYLEPLFRIQAHGSPNVRTTSLPDLVRSASKTLSTEDQFNTVHERLDYRILRRIYQLQNANKWSLRQMEKCKEPEQPLTHHDHMMSEMQWMRKDFKAERKMKKSVCAWLAQRCAKWVGATPEERMRMQVSVRPLKQIPEATEESEDQPPELEHSGESAPEDGVDPLTPRVFATVLPSSLIVCPELSATVSRLQKSSKFDKALASLPITRFDQVVSKPSTQPLGPVSKFVHGKVLPRATGPNRKRSRYNYEDDSELLYAQPNSKRLREERDLPAEDEEIALFHPDNKHIRDRLHANNAFRPPSEFVMPSTQFYEFRNGSQWIWEDDQKLKKQAKDYSFNWSLISDESQLAAHFKSSAERRTPWECFERWVELEQLPAEMKKTVYFKTWYQRLEQSQQAAERRYHAQVAAIQAQSNGQAIHTPMRRRTVPSRVEKRKNTRYLWLVDAMRKLARKKEQQAYKSAEAQRAAAQRKTQTDGNQQRAQMLTPQEFSRKRHERDLQIQEAQRQHRAKMMEAQQRQIMATRQAQQQAQQQGMQNGAPNQQRPGSSSNVPTQQVPMQPNGQQQQLNANGQILQQGRPPVPMATRNGHLAPPNVNAQGIPQAQMRPNGAMPSAQEMQRMAHANAQRNAQYGGHQNYQMQTGNMQSPGSGGMNMPKTQGNQAMLTSLQQQMNGNNHNPGPQHQASSHQMSQSPSMPPPPTPQSHPQTLSSGLVPAVINLQNQIRAKYPQHTEEQVMALATETLQTQSTNQARQNAMNAAAGINGGVAAQSSRGSNAQAYALNQYSSSGQMPNSNYVNGEVNGQQQSGGGGTAASPHQQYAQVMMQRQLQQMRMQQSPNSGHATLNGSPSLAHASPSMTPVSPNMQYSSMNHGQMASTNVPGMNAQQRPPSRSATPQMQRLGSSGNATQMGGLPSPGVNGLQGSPRNMQASMAR